jgi:uncharacterized protein (DUF2141 family)
LLIHSTLFALALSAQLAEPPSSAIVAGRVVDATSGRPIAGVVVTPAGSAVSASGSFGPARVLTNANGHFVLRGLAKGSLVLIATKGGYVNANYGQRRPGGTSQLIPVAAGQRLNDVELRMWKFAAISGAIADEAGDPVVGTRVQALQKSFVAGRRRFTLGPVAVTDDRGAYRIAGLTPGEYVVVVPSTHTSVPTDVMESFFTGTPIAEAARVDLTREMSAIGSAIAPAGSAFAMKAGGQTFSLQPGTLTPIVSATGIMIYPTSYYPAAVTPSQATTIAVRSADERTGIDLQISPVRGVRVSGVLLGPDGPSPTTGILLGLAGADEATDPIEAATTMTDATGAFTFPAVPAGQYVLRVVRVPRPPVSVDDMTRVSVARSGTMTISGSPAVPATAPPPIPADATLVARMLLGVGDRDVTDLIVTLSPGPRVSGRLEFEGSMERPAPASLTGMRIMLDRSDGSASPDSLLATQTGHPDEDGQFKTYGVPPGRYVLRVNPMPAGWFLKSAIYQSRDIADLPLELESKDANGVVITFTDSPARLSGTVRGANGPDPTAVVLVYPVDSEAWSSSGARARRMRTARAAKDGSYSLLALPGGEYYVVAVQEDALGDWQDPAVLRSLSRVAQTIRLLEGEQKTQHLTSAVLR